ncbi:MAG: hypothetical protein EBW15_09835, partial [Actinobacteria bacterium]|nr:hypothetical protein [Actinomycetota bacterium]
ATWLPDHLMGPARFVDRSAADRIRPVDVPGPQVDAAFIAAALVALDPGMDHPLQDVLRRLHPLALGAVDQHVAGANDRVSTIKNSDGVSKSVLP